MEDKNQQTNQESQVATQGNEGGGTEVAEMTVTTDSDVNPLGNVLGDDVIADEYQQHLAETPEEVQDPEPIKPEDKVVDTASVKSTPTKSNKPTTASTGKKSAEVKDEKPARLNPLDIIVEHETNPRIDREQYLAAEDKDAFLSSEYFSDEEEKEEFLADLLERGVIYPIQVFIRRIGKNKIEYHTAQGFRRMYSVLENLKRKPDAAMLSSVPVTYVTENSEKLLVNHISLNNSRALSPIAIARIIAQLNALGNTPEDIAEMIKYNLVKVNNYLTLMNGGSNKLIKAIVEKRVAMSSAIQFVKQNPDIAKQNQLLAQAIEEHIPTVEDEIKAESTNDEILNSDNPEAAVQAQLDFEEQEGNSDGGAASTSKKKKSGKAGATEPKAKPLGKRAQTLTAKKLGVNNETIEDRVKTYHTILSKAKKDKEAAYDEDYLNLAISVLGDLINRKKSLDKISSDHLYAQ